MIRCLLNVKSFLLILGICVGANAYAVAPTAGVTYTGRILDSNDQPVTATNVVFTITISDPEQKCWLYREQRQIDLSQSSGNFSFEVGSDDSTLVSSSASINNQGSAGTGGPENLADIFSNRRAFTGLVPLTYTSCTGTYDPSTSTDPNEGRILAVYFSVNGGQVQALPALRITPVPSALQAMAINGYDKKHILRIDPTIVNPTAADINATQLTELYRLINNPLTAYMAANPTIGGDITATSLSSMKVTGIQGAAVAAPTSGDTGKVLTYNGTSYVWSTPASSGITSLNGLTGSTQSFASGTTPLTITSSGSTHTFNITNASASSAGLLTQTDWNTFNSKQSSSLTSGQVWIGNASNGAEAQTLTGDATVSASGNVVVDKTQTAQASKILQLDSSGNAYVNGVDIKGSSAVTSLRYTGSTNLTLNLPTTSGSVSQFLQTDGAGNLSWASQSAMLPSISAGQVWVGNASNGAEAFTLSGDIASVSSTGLVTLTSSASGSNKLPLAGGTMSGTIEMSGNDITNAGNISLANNKYFGLSNYAAGTGTTAGQIWFDGANIKYFDGTTAKTLGVAGAGITSFNGASTSTQTLAVPGTSGTAPNWVTDTSGGVHYLNIPLAATSSVTAGLLSNSDYTALMAKQGSGLNSGKIWVGNSSNGAEARALSGDATIDNVGSVTVDKTQLGVSSKILQLDASGVANSYGVGIKGATSGTVNLLAGTTTSNYSLSFPSVAPSDNQILQVDHLGQFTWVSNAANVTNAASLASGQMWVGNASGIATAVTMTGDATLDNAGVLTLKSTGTAGTYYKVVTDAQGRVVSGSALASGDVTTALGYTPVNRAGDSMTGDLTTLNLNITAGKFLGLGVGSTAGTVAGQMWYDSGVIKYFDGTSAQSLGVAGAGITSLNGLTANIQSFVVDTNGTSPQMVSASSAHTLSIPMASTSAATAGLISNADYTSFKSAQSTSLASTEVWVGNASGAAQARTLSGDVTISNVGLVTVDKTTTGTSSKILQLDSSGVANSLGVGLINSGTVRLLPGSPSTASYDIKFPITSATANQILQSDATGQLSWISNVPTVTNAASLANGAMWIGNASGVAAAVTMSGDATIANTGLLTLKSTGTAGTYWKVVTDAQGRVTSGAALASGDVTTALGYTPANASTGYMNGGNTFSGNATIGLNDAYTLGFKTNNLTQMTLDSSGQLGIGTATPSTLLHLKSAQQGYDSGLLLENTGSSQSFSVSSRNDSGLGARFSIGDETAHVERLLITSTGYIGIGTSAPAYTLDLSGANDALRLPNGTTGQRPGNVAGLIRFNTSNSTLEYNDGTTWTTVGSSLGYTPVNRAGDTMTGDLTTLNLNITAGKYLGLGSGSTAGTVAGQMWYDSGTIKYFDGTSTKSLGVAGAGITSFNGSSASTQTLAVPGTSGTAPNWVTDTSGGVHYLNIPMASSASVTSGLISNADYTALKSAQSSALASGQMWVGNTSGAAQAFTLSGDVSSVSNTGSVTVNKTTTGTSSTILSLDGSGVGNMTGLGLINTGTVYLQASTASSTYTLKFPAGTPLANQILQSDATGQMSWVTNTASTGYVNGGNTFAGNATIGLNDAYTLGFKTSGTTQMTLDASGKLGIGTATPTALLDVNGAINISGTNGISYPSTDSTAGSSLAVGSGALAQQFSLTSAAYRNTAVGYQAMSSTSMTSAAVKNTALGYKAGSNNTTGYQNTFVGYNAGSSSGNGAARTSTAIGSNASIAAGTSGYDVVVVGANSSCCSGGTAGVVLGASSSGSGNGGIAIGNVVAQSGNSSIAVGSNSAAGQGGVVVVGSYAMSSSYNGISIGAGAGSANVTGNNNVLIGSEVGSTTLKTGARNLLIGVDSSTDSVAASTSNSMNIGNALYATNMKNATNTTGLANIGINNNAPAATLDVADTTTTTSAIIVPRAATFTGTTVNGMVRYNTSTNLFEFRQNGAWVNYSTASGTNLVVAPSTGSLIGGTTGASSVSTAGLNNIAYGYQSLNSLSSGSSNTALGYQVMTLDNGSANTAVGYQAAYSGGGDENVAIGNLAYYNSDSGNQNVAVGGYALNRSQGASGNTAVGYDAGDMITSGAGNVLLGWEAGNNLTTGSNNIVIGFNIGAPSGTGSNQLSIGNMIYGTGINGTGTTPSTGKIGIGTNSPSYTLQVAGTANATTFLMNGSSSAPAAKVTNAAEPVAVSATAATGTVNFYLAGGAVQYYTSNASANWTLNWAWSSGTTLDSALAVNDSVTTTFMVTQGSTAYYPSAFTIDGTSVTPKWLGGSAPTAGNASSVDVYTCTIIKTASATYSVLCAQAQYK